MYRTSATAVKMLLRQNGINVETNDDIMRVYEQLKDESENIRNRLDSMVNRYGLLQHMLGAVEAYKLQQEEQESPGKNDPSQTITPG